MKTSNLRRLSLLLQNPTIHNHHRKLQMCLVMCHSNLHALLLSYPSSYYPFYVSEVITGPPLWSSGQSSWLLTQSSWVLFPALPNFLHSCGSRMRSRKLRLTTVRDPPRSPRDTLLLQKLLLNFTDKWRSLSRYS
jgi:hypothetical protein